MERTQIYLPKQQLKELRHASRREETNVSAIIRMYLAEKLDELNHKRARQPSLSLLAAAKKINKIGKPGPKDLASNLDHYLYDKL